MSAEAVPEKRAPLALKRELRLHEGEVVCLGRVTTELQTEQIQIETETRRAEESLTMTLAQHVEVEKTLVAAGMQHDQARTELGRFEQQVAACWQDISNLRAEASHARERAERARQQHIEALSAREAAESEAVRAVERLNAMRQNLQIQQEQVSAKREELAGASQRLASAEQIEHRLLEESRQDEERLLALGEQQAQLTQEREELAANSAETVRQMEVFREEKSAWKRVRLSWKPNGKKPAAVPPISMTRCAPTARPSTTSAPPAAIAKWRKPVTIPTASTCADLRHRAQRPARRIDRPRTRSAPRRRAGRSGNELPGHEGAYRIHGPGKHDGPGRISAMRRARHFLRRERDDLLQSIENTRWPSPSWT